MPDGVEAVAVALVAIVPGATYTWSFERQAGAFGLAAVDRMLRFLTASLAFHLVLGWLEYLAWRTLAGDRLLAGQFAVVWAAAVVLVGLPLIVGWTLGTLWASQDTPDRHTRLRRMAMGRRPDDRDISDGGREMKPRIPVGTVGGYRGGRIPEGMTIPVPTSKGASVNRPVAKKKTAKKKSES
ncbi:MAG TPA: DUF6338 family protein [Acidimicrobiales bacterium]|nr:DUF6338 family protein [Acidimicrobiales bacterium]